MPLLQRGLLFLAFACCSSIGIRAQQPGITRYDLDDGLPQSMVNHVLQDRDGFIWLGTGDGLARFDGLRMLVYKHDPRDSSSLSHNAIWGLAEADEEHLWVATRTGLDLLDRRSGTFEHVATGAGVNGCWIPVKSTGDEAIFYSPLSRDLLRINSGRTSRIPSGHLDSYAFDVNKEGDLCLYTTDSIIVLPLDDRPGTAIKLDRTGDVSAIIEVNGKWLLLTDRGGWLVHRDGTHEDPPAELRNYLQQSRGLKYAARDPHGRLWIAISNVGVVQLRDDLSIERYYSLMDANEGSLSVTRIAFDRQGNAWVGTDGKGVIRIAPQRIKFQRCMAGMGLSWEPPSWFVRGFAQWDAQRVLVAFHQGGLALFDERTDRLEPLVLPGSGANTSWSHIFNDPSGTIWARLDGHVYAIDQRDGRPMVHAPLPGPVALLRDVEGHALLYAENRALRVERRGAAWDTTTMTLAFPDSLDRLAERLVMDPIGQWWTSGAVLPIGVWKDGVSLPLAGDVPDTGTLMTGFFCTGTDTAWMTTSNGLYSWSLRDRRVLRHLTIHDGSPDQYLYMMLSDGDGSWWVSSNNGLSHFDPQRGSFRNYTVPEGLQSREFNSDAAFRSASGRSYFGGVNGFNHFLPEAVRDDPDTALVRVVGTFVGDSPVPFEAGITLPFRRNELRVELAVLEFTAPEGNRYAYRLAGYDTTWRVQRADRPIMFTNLPSGSYSLLVKGINADGVESRELVLLAVQVPLPWWASPWAIAAAIALLAGVVGYVVYAVQRARARRRLAAAEHELGELRQRTRLAKEIHDDVGSGLARIAALSRSTKREADAAERFDKLADISGELLLNLRDVVWMNDPRHDTLDALLLRISDHARDLFEDSAALVEVRFPVPMPTHPVGGHFRHNLFLIAKEALHNAHKYSQAQRITLVWAQDAEGFRFEVIDDGVGITNGGAVGGGHGSANMRQRAEDLGARYERISLPGAGTTIRVQGRTFGP